MTRRRWLQIGLAAAALLGLAVLAALLLPHQVLCVDSGPYHADVLVVLGGGSYERPVRALELFRQKAAPRILLTGAGDNDSNRRILIKGGVPPADIQQEPTSATTRENALFTIPLLRQEGVHRVILVTSWYHSRRALNCFQHYGRGIDFYSHPSYYAYPRAQWVRQGIRGKIRAEYLKTLGYWLCYGVWPL